MAEVPFDPESDLCLGCGLCCNSGLFTHVRLTDDDQALLAEGGISAPTRIDQPCQFWDRCCTIYARRPAKCREYECELLEGVKSGAIELHQARETVETAFAMRECFVGEIGDTVELNKAVLAWFAQEPDARDSARMELMLSYVAYRMFVERHFLPPHRHWALSPSVEQVREANPPSESGPPAPSRSG